MGRPMRHLEPQVEQQGSFQHKLVFGLGNRQTVQQPFDRVSADDQVEILTVLAGSFEQTFVNACRTRRDAQTSDSK